MKKIKKSDDDDFIFRFGEPLSEEMVQVKLDDNLPKTTKRKNEWALSLFKG